MESASQVNVPLRSGGKKMRKRRELDALVAHSLAKRANKKSCAGNGVNSQDQLLSPSTDEQDDNGWPKVVPVSNRTRNRKFSLIQSCIPIIFVMSVALSLGFVYWLHFDLKQQLYDYRSRIEEVAMTSQNVPDALQKWHETSKTLEQNQTAINIKMLELQHMIDELRTRITLYQTQLNEKKDYSKEGKFVADFGAEIRAVSTDMEHIKDRLATFQTDQNTFRNDVDMLKGNFSEAIMNATRRANNNETNYSDEMKKSQTIVLDEIKSLSANLSLINDTLSQEAKILSADQTLQRNQLEKISEKTDNISSHVDSIEMKWTENKHLLSDLDTFKNNSNYEIQSLRNVTYDLKYALENMQKIALQSSSRDKTIKLEEKPYRNEDPPKTESTENNNMKTSTSTNAMVVPPLSTMSTKPVTTAATTVNQTNTTTGSNTTAVVNATVAAAAVEGKPKLLSIPISKIR